MPVPKKQQGHYFIGGIMNYRTYSDYELVREAQANDTNSLAIELSGRLERLHALIDEANNLMVDIVDTVDCYHKGNTDEILEMKAQSTWPDIQRCSNIITKMRGLA